LSIVVDKFGKGDPAAGECFEGLCHDGMMSASPSDPAPRPQEHRLPFRAPVRAWALSEWALVPLRLFLGVTFLYAGLQKLANPNFFKPRSPISIQAQLLAATHTSPIHVVLQHLLGAAKPIGLVIAFGEIAVGVGTLLGLWTRIAALGGLLLSLSLFLTVSYHSSPYFTGADIVFFFAWLPLLIAGGGTRLSLDAWIANRVARKSGRSSPELVPIPFATVQAICGNFDEGSCRARGGAPCDAAVCPVLLGGRAPLVTRGAVDDIDRRVLIFGGLTAAAAGAGVLLLGGAAADTGQLIGDAPKPTSPRVLTVPSTTATTTATPVTIATTTTTTPHTTTTPTTTTPPTTTTAPKHAGSLIGNASEVPDNSSAIFTIPSNNDPGIVIHTAAGPFVAYNAVCPHMGCTVGYSTATEIIVCPCHGSEFQVSDGDVVQGPATRGLTKLNIVEGSNGNLYLE
jgi:thiosulfate dehydrogenase (quinone) large subunit